MAIKASTMYQQGAAAEQDETDEPKNVSISTMMKGDHVYLKREGLRMEDFTRRSSPLMELPKLPTGSSYFQDRIRSRKINSGLGDETNEEDTPTISVIDGILEVMDYDFRIDDDEEYESDEEFMTVPVKMDNYVNKRTRASRSDRRRNELLLDNALAITDALRVIQSDETDFNLSSGDEESLDPGDIDFEDGYDSDLL